MGTASALIADATSSTTAAAAAPPSTVSVNPLSSSGSDADVSSSLDSADNLNTSTAASPPLPPAAAPLNTNIQHPHHLHHHPLHHHQQQQQQQQRYAEVDQVHALMENLKLADATPSKAKDAKGTMNLPENYRSPRMTGIVKFFNSQKGITPFPINARLIVSLQKKGYGFIIPDSRSIEVFVHHSAISRPRMGFRSLAEGEPVEFEMVMGDKGFQAANVTGPNGAIVQGDPNAHIYMAAHQLHMQGLGLSSMPLSPSRHGASDGLRKSALGGMVGMPHAGPHHHHHHHAPAAPPAALSPSSSVASTPSSSQTLQEASPESDTTASFARYPDPQQPAAYEHGRKASGGQHHGYREDGSRTPRANTNRGEMQGYAGATGAEPRTPSTPQFEHAGALPNPNAYYVDPQYAPSTPAVYLPPMPYGGYWYYSGGMPYFQPASPAAVAALAPHPGTPRRVDSDSQSEHGAEGAASAPAAAGGAAYAMATPAGMAKPIAMAPPPPPAMYPHLYPPPLPAYHPAAAAGYEAAVMQQGYYVPPPAHYMYGYAGAGAPVVATMAPSQGQGQGGEEQ
ncbi:Y box binding protein 1 [Phlyctochytrium bullatum]|nr:Y box binding protein 1 [Phlyctochytrium bullatum]